MIAFNQLPADQQQTIREEMDRRYIKAGGDDIDRAIKRHRRTLEQHDRELDHVATLDFDKPYRWRIAPSVALRAEKALEYQKKKRSELRIDIYEEILEERGYTKRRAPAPSRDLPTSQDMQELTAQFAQALNEIKDWKLESAEDSPPVTSAA